MGKVETLINGADGHTRGAAVRVLSSGQHSSVLKRPIQRLYHLEVQAADDLMVSLPENTIWSDDALAVKPSVEHASAELAPTPFQDGDEICAIPESILTSIFARSH